MKVSHLKVTDKKIRTSVNKNNSHRIVVYLIVLKYLYLHDNPLIQNKYLIGGCN